MSNPSIMPLPRQRYYDNNGVPLTNGMIYTYAAGTSTPQAAYQDSAGMIPHPNPIRLDAKGEATIYWLGSYRVDAKTEAGVSVTGYPVDNYTTPPDVTNNTGTAAVKGTWFGGVLAYVSDLAGSIGASLIGFIQAGAGAIAMSIQDALREKVSVKQFGAMGDDTADDTAAINAAKTYCLSATPHKRLHFPAGTYKTSSTLNFDYPGLIVSGDGRLNSIIHYTGSGVAVQFTDAHPNNGSYTFGGEIRDIGICGNAASTTLLYVKNVNHFTASSINLKESSTTLGVGLQVVGTVCGHFKDIICSTNEQLMSSRPFNGIVVDRDPTTMSPASANKFDNVIIEGMTGDGIQLVHSDQSLFIGGTSENNGGNGVTITINSRINTFISMGFENPLGYADIFDSGFSNRFTNCYSNHLVYVSSTSQFFELTGGYHQSITVVGDFATIRDLKYSFFAAGGAVTTSLNTSTRNLFNANTGGITYNVKAPITVTVGASPFTYTNVSGMAENVICAGGTVTQLVMGRFGAVANLPVTGGMWLLGPNDSLTWSYTAAPTVSRLPFGTNFT